jgi:hypothetical protein
MMNVCRQIVEYPENDTKENLFIFLLVLTHIIIAFGLLGDEQKQNQNDFTKI